MGVARALAADPPVLLMDEPFGAVDPIVRAQLQREFRRLQQEMGKTVVFVTHDVDEAIVLGSRIAVMQTPGHIAPVGDTRRIALRPVDGVRPRVHRPARCRVRRLRTADRLPRRDAVQRVIGSTVFADVPIWSGPQLSGNWDVIRYYTLQHLRYTVIAVTLGTAVALPLSYLAVRRPGTYPALLVATNVIYAIPSIALFVMLGPWLGFTNDKPIVTAMVLYTLVILVRNIVEAVRSVPPAVVRAADGMGYRPLRRFVVVELPLAVPGIVAGLRLATVSTVSLISVGALIGRGALGPPVLRRPGTRASPSSCGPG